MVDRNANSFVVQVELPSELEDASQAAAPDVADAMRVLWLVELVRQRRLGVGRAARLSGKPLLDFYRELAKHGVAALDIDPEELDQDLEDLSAVMKAS